MSDTLEVVEQPVTSIPVTVGENAPNPFDEWSETPPQAPAAQQQQPAAPASPATPQTPATPAASAATVDDETFDENDYLKNTFGFESAESARAELQRLRDLEKNPPKPAEPQFANDDSRKIFDLIKSGKISEVRQYLDQQDRLDRLSKTELSNADSAREILRANMAFKNPDLTQAEIDRYISKKFSFPTKPANNLDLTPEENIAALQAWEQQVKDIETDMIIEAKMVRPELSKFKSELVLPDIPQVVDPAVAEAQQKELQQWQTMRNNYLETLDRDIKNFNGFSVKYKDNDVEYDVPFSPTDQEKTELKTQLSDFNRDQFFDSRWFDKDGKPLINEIAADLYLLRNRDAILKKMVGEGGRQMLAAQKKERAHITVGTQPQQTWNPSDLSEQEKQERAIMEA